MGCEKMKLALLYYVIINIIAAIVTVADKTAAKKGSRRISEKTLFAISFLGGSFLMFAVMRIIRHKTLHNRFMLGLPIISLLHLGIIARLYGLL